MSLRVSFELSTADLGHFRTIMREARDAAADKPRARSPRRGPQGARLGQPRSTSRSLSVTVCRASRS